MRRRYKMDAISALKERRSIRRYQDKEITKQVIRDIIDCGRLAATANNRQLWEFIVVTDRQMLKEISSYATYGKFIAQAAACILVLGPRDYRFLVEDCSAATQNIMVAAMAHGIGSCWVAGYGKDYSAIERQLGVPEEYVTVALIPIGYPAENPQKEKRSVDDVLHWDRF
jgi:nitroreductase